MLLFADGKDDINKWLDAHPLVLAAGAVVFAVVFFGLAVSVYVTGKAPQKKGKDLEGGQAMAMGVLWFVMGLGCLGLAVYKTIAGLR